MQSVWKHRTGESFVEEIGLIDEILAVGSMVISREIERGVGGFTAPDSGSIAGIDVLVKFLVVGEDCRVLHRQSISKIVIDEGHRLLHVGPCNIEIRATEKRCQVSVGCEWRGRIETGRRRRHGAKRLRRIAAVGGALIVKIFVAELDLGGVIGFKVTVGLKP